MFSKACEYGMRAAVFVARSSLNGERVSLKDITKGIDAPDAFTAKILQQLAREKILLSVKGPKGGFEIRKDKMNSIPIARVVDAIDGNGIYTGCGLGLGECDENNPCPLHENFSSIREQLEDMLENTSIYDLAINLDGFSTLKMY